WTTLFDGVLSAHLNGAPNATDAPVTLVPPALDADSAARWIAVVPPNVYYSIGTGALMRVSETGGTPSTVVESGVNPNVRLAADSESGYWVNAPADTIERTRVK